MDAAEAKGACNLLGIPYSDSEINLYTATVLSLLSLFERLGFDQRTRYNMISWLREEVRDFTTSYEYVPTDKSIVLIDSQYIGMSSWNYVFDINSMEQVHGTALTAIPTVTAIISLLGVVTRTLGPVMTT